MGSGVNILLVEDDSQVLEMVKMMLEKSEYMVQGSTTPGVAISPNIS